MNPRYPIFVPSKGRYAKCHTALFLQKEGVPFHLVVEPQEAHHYIERFGEDSVLVLPFSNKGSVIPTRNWIRDYSQNKGHLRHWQLDDNMMGVVRWYRGKRIARDSAPAFCCVEDFTDRYENIAIAGLNYTMYGINKLPPFFLNAHVYSCTLFLNSTPFRWRGTYNEDTDICLQALSQGWCTVLVNVFLINKLRTMTMTGGNTSAIYHGDGRLKMARALERAWPKVVTTKRRFKRPQHSVAYSWRKFDNKLIRKKGIRIPSKPNEYGLTVTRTRKTVKSKRLKDIEKEFTQDKSKSSNKSPGKRKKKSSNKSPGKRKKKST